MWKRFTCTDTYALPYRLVNLADGVDNFDLAHCFVDGVKSLEVATFIQKGSHAQHDFVHLHFLEVPVTALHLVQIRTHVNGDTPSRNHPGSVAA